MNQLASSSSSVELAHNLAVHFSKLAHEYSVDLPEYSTDKICRHCSSFLVPSLTSSVRLLRKKKGRDEIVSTCLKCAGITKRVPKPQMKKKTKKRKIEAVTTVHKDSVNKTSKSKSFSFLDKSKGSSSDTLGGLSGDFVPLSNSPAKQQQQQSVIREGVNLLEMERENKRRKKEERRKRANATQISTLSSLKSMFSSNISNNVLALKK